MKLHIPRRTLRTPAVLALAATAITGVLTATTAGPSAAPATSPVAYNARPAQGGCRTYDARGLSGFNIGVCVNDRATGTTAYPDIYVNTARHPGMRETCKIDIETWDDNNHKLGDTVTDCAVGHHTGNPVKVTGAATVHAFARLHFDGSSYATGDSPSVSLAPNANNQVFYDHDFPVYNMSAAGYAFPVKSTPANAFKELHRCFNCSFPVPGAPAAFPANGQQLALHGLVWPTSLPIFGAVLPGPSLFYSYPSQNSFAVIARLGHQDGAAAAVTFHFSSDSNGYLHLRVTAVSVHGAIWDWVLQTAAYQLWGSFSTNLGANLVAHGEGTSIPS